MKARTLYIICTTLLALCSLAACKESDSEYSPYTNWKSRNDAWFLMAMDTARTEIAKAKQTHGDAWEDNCQWRIYKSLLRSSESVGKDQDNIVVKILKHGDGTFSPAYTDSVQLHFRGYLMPTEYETSNDGTREERMYIFTQTYYGTFNPDIASPQYMAVGGTVEGFMTALQYMVKGDEWLVYIPQELAYGAKESGTIPAFSSLLFHLYVQDVVKSGTGTSVWK